ncbi:MAG TPA: (4Fe-4S)-binding protein [Clostridiales bacterium]|nr:MAG: hypothetical protein A2Y22_08545 [Clostridiales bacterium GWD2_32_59]HAN09389.1 (4Fe-4S)-binding protein [Clostridiales bacterium]
MYKKLISYYYTGTGNSYRVASWVADKASRKALEVKMIPVGKYDKKQLDDTDADTIIHITFPTHALTAPFSVIKFVRELPKAKGQKVMITATRSGGAFLKDMPGCEGTGSYLIGLILALKGYNIVSVEAIDMPPNWNVMLPTYTVKKNEYIIGVSNTFVNELSEKILSGKKVYGGFISFLIGLVCLPLSLAYLFAGRFFLPKMLFSNHKCTGCGLCAKSCPVGAIKMLGKEEKRPYWKFSCESCMRCTAFCPNNAVEAHHIILIFAMFIGLTGEIFDIIYLRLKPIITIPDLNNVVSSVAQVILALGFTYITNYLLFILNRNKLINKFFTYTSLTHYMKRYKEPDTKIEEIL